MNTNTADTLDIADLEYEVGGTSSLEPAHAEASNEYTVIWFVAPK